MRKYIVTILIVIILTSLCIYAYAENITGLQEQSIEITEALNQSNNRLQAVKDELSTNMQQLQKLDNQVAQSQNELNKINIEVDELISQITENEEKLSKVQAEYDSLQDTLNTRLIQIYETPQLQFLQIILESKSVTDFLATYYAMQELAEYDAELLETVKKQKQDIETTKKFLAEKKQQVVQRKQAKQKKTQVLDNAKTMREYYISKLTAEEQALQAEIDEYNFQVSAIEAEIKLLALNSITDDYIGGAMRWPIPGYDRITSQYGMRVHPITGAYKLHTGVDVGAPMGASFVAAANGIVTKATFNYAYGNMVIIDHGGGVQTLYAHGSEIIAKVGQIVRTGDEVLKVGSTGYSTGPHAHFEIRVNGQTLDPLHYLLENEEQKENANTEENIEQTDTNNS